MNGYQEPRAGPTFEWSKTGGPLRITIPGELVANAARYGDTRQQTTWALCEMFLTGLDRHARKDNLPTVEEAVDMYSSFGDQRGLKPAPERQT